MTKTQKYTLFLLVILIVMSIRDERAQAFIKSRNQSKKQTPQEHMKERREHAQNKLKHIEYLLKQMRDPFRTEKDFDTSTDSSTDSTLSATSTAATSTES